MWKESYRIGDELIDSQHKELFDTTEALLNAIKSEDAVTRKQECINAIVFFRDYVTKHFAAEEEYQESIGYMDIEAHKTLHRIFAATIERETQNLFDDDFSEPTVKEFTGFLSMWLVYHVAGIDQKLKKNESLTFDKTSPTASYVDCFEQSVKKTLNTMAGLASCDIVYSPYKGKVDDIKVLIGLIGEPKGEVVFTYTKEIALNLLKAMTSIEHTEVDQLTCSAMSETTNIISGNASSLIAATGKDSDITTPTIVTDFPSISDRKEGFYVDTELGRMAIAINIA